jgi:hypothetical protein
MVAMLVYAYSNPQLKAANPKPTKVEGPDDGLV